MIETLQHGEQLLNSQSTLITEQLNWIHLQTLSHGLTNSKLLNQPNIRDMYVMMQMIIKKLSNYHMMNNKLLLINKMQSGMILLKTLIKVGKENLMPLIGLQELLKKHNGKRLLIFKSIKQLVVTLIHWLLKFNKLIVLQSKIGIFTLLNAMILLVKENSKVQQFTD